MRAQAKTFSRINESSQAFRFNILSSGWLWTGVPHTRASAEGGGHGWGCPKAGPAALQEFKP